MLLHIFASGQFYKSHNCLSLSLPSDLGTFEIRERHYPCSSELCSGTLNIETDTNIYVKYYISGGMVVVLDNKINLFAEFIDDIKNTKKQNIDLAIQKLGKIIESNKNPPYQEFVAQIQNKINHYKNLAKLIT